MTYAEPLACINPYVFTIGGVSLLHQGGQNNFFHTNMFSLMFARTHTHTHTHTKRISHDGTSLDEVQHQLLHYNVVARSIHLKKIVLPSAEVSVFFCVLRKRPQPSQVTAWQWCRARCEAQQGMKTVQLLLLSVASCESFSLQRNSSRKWQIQRVESGPTVVECIDLGIRPLSQFFEDVHVTQIRQ